MKRAQFYWNRCCGRTAAMGDVSLCLKRLVLLAGQPMQGLGRWHCQRAFLTPIVHGCVWLVMLSPATAQDPPAPAKPQEVETTEQNEQLEVDKSTHAPDDAEVDAAEIVIVEDAVDPFGVDAAAQDTQLLLLKVYIRVNSALARRVCSLCEAEEVSLAQLDDRWLEEQRKGTFDVRPVGVGAGIARFLRGGGVVVQNVNNPDSPELIKQVKKKIDEAIEEALTPEHREAFAREREARDDFRKKAMAAVLVAALDERLYLTQSQRDDLELGVAKWLKQDLYWQFYSQNQGYVPDIPKSVLSKVLTATQLRALQGVQAYNYDMSNIEMQLLDQDPVVIAR